MKESRTGPNSKTRKGPSPFHKKVRRMEQELTKGLIKWKLRRDGSPPCDDEVLDKGSEQIVNEAHTIIKRRAKSTLEEIKRAKQEFLKAYRNNDEK